MRVLAIDPGATGGIAWVTTQHAFAWPMPKTRDEIVEHLQEYIRRSPDAVILEKAITIPRDGRVGAFNYGVGYGVLLGATTALLRARRAGRPEEVLPKTWQAHYPDCKTRKVTRLAKSGNTRIERSKRDWQLKAKALFPGLDVPEKAGLYHDGCADALLIARWRQSQLHCPA